MFGGNALSPLLASGILKLDGKQGIKGWQWLFLRAYPSTYSLTPAFHLPTDAIIVEGLFTMVVSIMLFLLLPGSPDVPKPLGSKGFIRFSESEQEVLQKRLELDDKERRPGAQGMHIPLSVVWKTVRHYRRWPHYVSTFAVFSTWSPLTTYTPSIIM